jgi:Fe-S-cluster-containing dehydrogenase component
MCPRDITGKYTGKNCDEACTEWNYNAVGSDNFLHKSKQQTKTLTHMCIYLLSFIELRRKQCNGCITKNCVNFTAGYTDVQTYFTIEEWRLLGCYAVWLL